MSRDHSFYLHSLYIHSFCHQDDLPASPIGVARAQLVAEFGMSPANKVKLVGDAIASASVAQARRE